MAGPRRAVYRNPSYNLGVVSFVTRRPTSSIVLVTCIHQRTTGDNLFTIQFLFHCGHLFYACGMFTVCVLDSQFSFVRCFACFDPRLAFLFIFIFRSLGYSPFSCTLLLLHI